MAVRIRIAREEDAEALLAVYAPYVEYTAVTFEYDVPSVEEFRGRIRATLTRYPYLVAEQDGQILGYAYVSAFHPRAAYSRCVETSVYLAESARRQGIGRLLYSALENVLKEMQILNANACIAIPQGEDPYLTDASVRFHERMGYRMVGSFRDCGYKFGRWYGMCWMEKMLGEHRENPDQVLTFEEVRKSVADRYGIS